MGEWLAFTFALTGRREWGHGTQGVALGWGLNALSGRSCSRYVRLSCAHALPLIIWLKTAQRFFWILNTHLRTRPLGRAVSTAALSR